MKLTKEQIKDFEIREKEANCCDDFRSIAEVLNLSLSKFFK